MFTIEFKVKTISNCLIGNQTESFSIGGVDQATTVDVEGFPIIHGSAIKGCLRNIVREENKVKCLMPSTMKFLKEYLNDLYKKYDTHSEENDVIKNLKKTIEIYEKECKVEYIFGIEGLNTMPRLFFLNSGIFSLLYSFVMAVKISIYFLLRLYAGIGRRSKFAAESAATRGLSVGDYGYRFIVDVYGQGNGRSGTKGIHRDRGTCRRDMRSRGAYLRLFF